MTKDYILVRGALCAAILATASWRADAAVNEIDIGFNPVFQQTGPTTVNPLGAFFSARADLDSASDFDGGTLTYPAPGSPGPLTPATGPILAFEPATFPTLAALNTAFPFGTYTFDATNSVTLAHQTDSIDYTVAAAALSVPTLTALSFNALQGLNASSGLAVDFNSFLTNSNANEGLLFVTISDAGGSVFSESFSDLTTTSFDLPGGTLSPGTDYTLDINFSERITGNDGAVPTTMYFDTHTLTDFSTSAVPEPAAWALMLIGFGTVGLALRSRRRPAPAVV
jgi:hypothetical protein